MITTKLSLFTPLLLTTTTLSSPLNPRQIKPLPLLTVQSEYLAECRIYPDIHSALWYGYKWAENAVFNATCWVEPTYALPDGHRIGGEGSSGLWLWIQRPEKIEGLEGPQGVGNGDLGGIATGGGCWVNEWQVKGGEIDFESVLRGCGRVPVPPKA
ncbi:hypothetical protein B0J11DRAFT_502381 [Dendryphion nanum]|uniref:Uncharacterized protein n=1 Tax=Dendryphion nanum TaxID=256645 RepID=A0A9P9EDC5_9PLEO|nr:hypothetical protein B0J11DRAFT_502381 [Dendryphion nanum]